MLDLLVVVLVFLSSEFEILFVLEQVLLVGKRFLFLIFQFRVRVVVSVEVSELPTMSHDQRIIQGVQNRNVENAPCVHVW